MRAFVVPLAPMVAALYTVKAVVLPEPLPKMFVPAASKRGSSCVPGSTRWEQTALAFSIRPEEVHLWL